MPAEAHQLNHHRRIETLDRDSKLLWGKLFILRPVQVEILRGGIGCCLDMVYLLSGSAHRDRADCHESLTLLNRRMSIHRSSSESPGVKVSAIALGAGLVRFLPASRLRTGPASPGLEGGTSSCLSSSLNSSLNSPGTSIGDILGCGCVKQGYVCVTVRVQIRSGTSALTWAINRGSHNGA